MNQGNFTTGRLGCQAAVASGSNSKFGIKCRIACNAARSTCRIPQSLRKSTTFGRILGGPGPGGTSPGGHRHTYPRRATPLLCRRLAAAATRRPPLETGIPAGHLANHGPAQQPVASTKAASMSRVDKLCASLSTVNCSSTSVWLCRKLSNRERYDPGLSRTCGACTRTSPSAVRTRPGS